MNLKQLFKGRKIPSSIFLMILCTNLLSIMVLSFFNYYVFHSMSKKAYLESFISYNQNTTELALKNIDKQIMQSAIDIGQLYFSPIKENDSLLLPQVEKIIGKPRKITALISEMKKIKRNYPYIDSIDIYYEATDTVVTGFDKVHFSKDEEMLETYLPWLKENQHKGDLQEFVRNPKGAYPLNKPVITYIKRITQSKWNGKDILLAIHVDPVSFLGYLDGEKGSLGILTREGEVLYDSSSKELGNFSMEELAQEAKSDQSITTFNMMSPVSGLFYFYQIDNNQFYQDYNVTNRMFLWNFLISIVFNILVLVLISYYSYTTYRKRILTLSKDVGISIDDSKQSFDGSLQVLTNEISTLHDTINSSKGLLFQSAVRSMILNRKTEEIHPELEPYLGADSISTHFLYLSERDVENLVVENLQKKYPPSQRGFNILFTTIDKDGLVAVLIFDRDKKEQALAYFISEMDLCWENYHMVSGIIFPAQKDGVKKSYKTTLETAKYRFIFKEEKLLAYEAIGIEKRKSSGSHLKLFEAMERDINNENFLNFKTKTEELIISFKSGNYTIEYCNSTLRDLVTLLYQVMQQNNLDMWVVFGYDIREYYKQITDIDGFSHWCSGLCEVILKTIRQKKKSVDIDIQTKIISLINDNLENNISLDYLADQLHVRSDVASRMFRQMMGKNYTDYIKEKKLNHAIELMKENYTMNEIAEKLCYSSAQYFIKIFKENYGTTPYQYKKKLEKLENEAVSNEEERK